MKKETKNWLDSALYDLDTAEAMLSSRRYIYVIFFCHLAIEKTLKGIIAETSETPPPRIHDLISLGTRARVQLSRQHQDFLGKLTSVSVPTRYPEEIRAARREYTRKRAMEVLTSTREVMKWLKLRPPYSE
jgi:HEPN domain-containing protein